MQNIECLKEYQQIINYINPENKTSEVIKISPSGKYKLIITSYKTKEKCWKFTCGEIYKVSNDELICKIPRNYSDYLYSFFTKNNQEWFVTGITYMSQTFVNLDTCEIFDDILKVRESDNYKNGGSLCWVEAWASPDGNTLAVNACFWGGEYNIYFYDISDISKGWNLIEQIDYYECSELKNPHWNDNNTFTIYSSSYYKKYNDILYHFHEDEYHNPELENIIDDEYIDSEYIMERNSNKVLTIHKKETENKIRWTTITNARQLKLQDITNKKWENSEIYQKLHLLMEHSNYIESKCFKSNNFYSPQYVNGSDYMVHYYNYKLLENNSDEFIKKEITIKWNDSENEIIIEYSSKKNNEKKEYKFEKNINFIEEICDLIKRLFM